MASAPFMPLYIGDYLQDTSHLSTLEHGALLLLLMRMWSAGGTLPNDERMLAKCAKLTPANWAKVRDAILPVFQIDGDQLRQKRLTAELRLSGQGGASPISWTSERTSTVCRSCR